MKKGVIRGVLVTFRPSVLGVDNYKIPFLTHLSFLALRQWNLQWILRQLGIFPRLNNEHPIFPIEPLSQSNEHIPVRLTSFYGSTRG